MIVKINLTNGSCQTLHSTIESLANIPKPNENNEIYIGRSKEGFSEVLKYLRGGANALKCNHIEDFIIHGLYEPSKFNCNLIHINVGGTIFFAREEILKTMSYFESSINNSAHKVENFIDENPEDFANFLHVIESRYHESECDLIPDESQALFFGYEIKKKNQDCVIAPIKATDKYNAAGLIGVFAFGAQNAYTHSKDISRSQYLQEYLKQSLSSFQFNTVMMEKGTNTENVEFKAAFSRNCDLAGNTYLCIDFESGFVPSYDQVFDTINKVQLKIGNDVFDSYSGDAMRVFSNNSQYKVEIYESHVFIPLNFFYQSKPALFIPLLSLGKCNVVVSVFLNAQAHVNTIAIMYKAIYLESQERIYFSSHPIKKEIYVTVEEKHTDIIVDSKQNVVKLNLKNAFKNIAKDIFIYLKPKFEIKDKEPLHQIELHFNNNEHALEFNPILTRKIIPREMYGIEDNKELIYYIPMNNSFNFSRLEDICLKLSFAILGTYDIIIISKMSNVMKIAESMATLEFSTYICD